LVNAGSGIGASDTIRVQVPFKGSPPQRTALVLHAYPDEQLASYLQSHAAAAGSGDRTRPKAANGNPRANTLSIAGLLVICRPRSLSVVFDAANA
jgi:hypothetical protein